MYFACLYFQVRSIETLQYACFCFLLDLFFRRFQDHGQFCWLCVPRALWVSYMYLSHVAFKVLFSRQWIDTVIAAFLAHKLFRYATNVETEKNRRLNHMVQIQRLHRALKFSNYHSWKRPGCTESSAT